MNTASLIGRLGKDPEQRTAGNSTLCSINIAVDDGTKDKPHTSWFKVVGWDKTADAMSRLTKGERVGVEGRLRQDEYVDKDGNKRSDVHIVAMRITYFGEGKRVEGSGDYSGGAQAAKPAPAADAPINEDELPF